VRIGLISDKILLKTYFRRPSCGRRKLDFICVYIYTFLIDIGAITGGLIVLFGSELLATMGDD
jgi:hypothetical protein